ncbi:MAG: ribosome biogenesis GTPase Der [Planctomycetes bacterium]|nr:ribosome biogenesis GTPase Der [Planctomycetota bacterium]
MPMGIVAIVGRPNVGKSSLLNCLARQRIAIVDPTAGVTRDRVSTIIEFDDRYFELVDTGGMGIEDADALTDEVEAQITHAIDEAHVLLMVVDVREGVTPLDKLVAARLRKQTKPVILVANKADSEKLDQEAPAFFGLGLGEPLCISATEHRRREQLLEAIAVRLPEAEGDERPAETAMRIAIVGKRNAGKSTFINSLAGEPRVIVSEVPGTTRDSVDIRIEKDGLVYTVIDTAGLRKKRKVKGDIEYYSRVRAEEAIRRADVTMHFIDATVPLSGVDKHLGSYVMEHRKPVVLVVNKWDLAMDKATTSEFGDYISHELPGLEFAPIAFTTALDSKNIETALDVARSLYKQARTRVSTSRINKAIEEAVRRRKPPSGKQGQMIRLYYGTQVAVDPPTLTLFVNDPVHVTADYARYLVNRFRETLPFAEVPLRLIFRRSGGEEEPDRARRKGGAAKRGERKHGEHKRRDSKRGAGKGRAPGRTTSRRSSSAPPTRKRGRG